eukprot:TRINITY_DN580_c0_g1_i1.p1 TRINITY_DN580_c0_g1~~TRINITY_DN580_c0_g1_i1.p1  ORF type:complete len:355 (-),score=48.70 TRINITY_DN580_c0_g1_i1:103-1167(-)
MLCFKGSDEQRFNLVIEEQIRKDKKVYEQELKLLLLGTAESGKSTVAKQLKILHQNGFSADELQSYTAVIHHNILLGIYSLLNTLKYHNHVELPPDLQKLADNFQYVDPSPKTYNFVLDPQMAEMVQTLWAHPLLKECYQNFPHHESYIPDSASYFLDNVRRIASPQYVPTPDDVLRSRKRTTGIVESKFEMQGARFSLLDVGGQRNERRKWIHCFENVSAVLFCVSLPEYDQMLLEDLQTNRMRESLALFGDISNSQWFAKSAMILFLNKCDIFKEKITKTPLSKYFPEYTGGANYEKACEFMKAEYCKKATSGKEIFTHITCATNTSTIEVVFSAVLQTVLTNSLSNAGYEV